MQDDLKRAQAKIEQLNTMILHIGANTAEMANQYRDRIAALEAKLAEKDAQLAEARAESERLRGALRVYAGPMEWTQEGGWGAFPVWADGYPGGVYVDDNTLDYGDAARAALAKIKDATDAALVVAERQLRSDRRRHVGIITYGEAIEQ